MVPDRVQAPLIHATIIITITKKKQRRQDRGAWAL